MSPLKRGTKSVKIIKTGVGWRCQDREEVSVAGSEVLVHAMNSVMGTEGCPRAWSRYHQLHARKRFSGELYVMYILLR